MITQNQPVRFEWRNFRRSFRTAKIGDVHLIQVEVDAKTWQDLDTMPKDADGEMVIWWETRGESIGKEPKPPKEPTPYGKFWQAMDKAGFHNRPDVRQWLQAVGLSEQEAKTYMRERFNVKSRGAELSQKRIVDALTEASFLEAADFVEGLKY